MTHIDTAMLELQKRRLRDRATQLRQEVLDTLERSGEEHHAQIAGEVRDPEDDSFADLIVDVKLAEVDRDVFELRAIDEALLRIKDGRYGHCEDCGGGIAPERLEAEPTALRCIDCQGAYERRQVEAQSGPPRL